MLIAFSIGKFFSFAIAELVFNPCLEPACRAMYIDLRDKVAETKADVDIYDGLTKLKLMKSRDWQKYSMVFF